AGGVATPPAIAVAPVGLAGTPVLFGATALNTGPTVRVLNVTNTGGGTLNVTGVTIATGQANQFTVVNDGCTGVPVGAGGSCTIDVGFVPTAGAPLQKNTVLTVASNAGSQNVALRGNVALIQLAQATVASPTDFGRRRIGEPRTQTVLVTNTGAAN